MAFLHGEYALRKDAFGLHWHGFASGDYLVALENLRQGRKFAPGVEGDGRDAIARPVVIKREPMTDLPYPLTYLLKSFYPAVATIEGDRGEKPRLCTQSSQDSEPYHALSLLWLNKWNIVDISLLMGMRVTREGLTLNTG